MWLASTADVDKSSFNSKGKTTRVQLGLQNSNPFQYFSHSFTYGSWRVSITKVRVLPITVLSNLGLEHEDPRSFGPERIFIVRIKSVYSHEFDQDEEVLAHELPIYSSPLSHKKRVSIEEIRVETPETETALIKCPLIRLPKEWRFHLGPSQGGPVTWLRGAPQPRVPGVALCCDMPPANHYRGAALCHGHAPGAAVLMGSGPRLDVPIL